MRRIEWIGDVPERCQITRRPITTAFVDGHIPGLSWAVMHPDEFKRYGGRFGLGMGQLYEKQADGHWLKVKG